MSPQNYTCSITANITPAEAFEGITRVSGWWATNVRGNCNRLNDIFTVHFGETFSTFRVIEWVPEKRIAWSVIDCYLDLLKNRLEWQDTKLTWEISAVDGGTQITMTHIGLVPALECFADCEKGWNFYIMESLLPFLTKDKGLPGTGIHATIEIEGREIVREDYHCQIIVNTGVMEAFEGICRVSDWWATDFEGQSGALNDVFTIHFGDTFVSFVITEAVPGRRIVWQVSDSWLPWLNDKTEWTGTKLIWEISAIDPDPGKSAVDPGKSAFDPGTAVVDPGTAAIPGKVRTRINMIHIGLTPQIECYNNCVKGWDFFVKQSLFKLLTEKKGLPDTPRPARAVN